MCSTCCRSHIDWRIVGLTLLMTCVSCIQAQRINFHIVKNHMIAEVTLNGSVKAQALMDTGSSITIIDSTFLAQSGLSLQLKEGRHRVRFPALKKILYCWYVLEDTLRVDGLRSSRPVYVADMSQVNIPGWSSCDMIMGSCYIAKDGSQMLTLNIGDGYVEYGKRELPEKKYKRGVMTVDGQGFVGTDAPLRILTKDYVSGQINGRFMIDTGNANFFCLFGKSEKLQDFLQRKDIELVERAKNGKTHYGIRMDTAEMLGKEVSMDKFLLPVLPTRSRGDYAGAIGYKFLREVELVLDYDHHCLYIR